MSIVCFADITNYSWDFIKHHLSILPDKEREKILNKRKEEDRCLSLLGKMLLLRILKEYEDWKEKVLPELLFNPYGKPYIDGMGSFNISHSGNVVVCGYSDAEIGIDIEEIHPIDLDEFKSVLTPNEYNLLKSSEINNFYRVWTQKEAIMKATGKGFYLNPLDIDLGEDLGKDSFEIRIDNQNYQIQTSDSLQGYIVTVATSVF